MADNKFDQLVEDLLDGSMTLTLIQIAIRTYYRRSKDTPEEIINLLCGDEGTVSLIQQQFSVIQQTIGCMKLAVARGKHHD